MNRKNLALHGMLAPSRESSGEPRNGRGAVRRARGFGNRDDSGTEPARRATTAVERGVGGESATGRGGVGGAFEKQLREDADSVRQVFAGLHELELELNEAVRVGRARQRGYFTPDEEDRVRQMLLAYRNYRLGLYNVIYRYADYARIPDPYDRLRAFCLAFAAALMLYAKTVMLIEIVEPQPLYRRKLNEADDHYGLRAGFFEELRRGFASFSNYRLISQAQRFWLWNRRDIKRLGICSSAEWGWLCATVRAQRGVVRRGCLRIFLRHVRCDWRWSCGLLFAPLLRAAYWLRTVWMGGLAGVRTTTHYVPALEPGILARVRERLAPGDVLLVRAERKLTAELLPGFWTHAAIYLGDRRELARLGVGELPHARKHWEEVPEWVEPLGCVIEAIAPRVCIHPLEVSLRADHVAVLRPVLADRERAQAIATALVQLGKPYDFEFDFNVSSRIVCTELIYRSFHRCGGIAFTLTKRLGRFTLTGDDIAAQALAAMVPGGARGEAAFELILFATHQGGGEVDFLEGAAAVARLRQIRNGARPGRPTPMFRPVDETLAV